MCPVSSYLHLSIFSWQYLPNFLSFCLCFLRQGLVICIPAQPTSIPQPFGLYHPSSGIPYQKAPCWLIIIVIILYIITHKTCFWVLLSLLYAMVFSPLFEFLYDMLSYSLVKSICVPQWGLYSLECFPQTAKPSVKRNTGYFLLPLSYLHSLFLGQWPHFNLHYSLSGNSEC